jgi:hypothetical protein
MAVRVAALIKDIGGRAAPAFDGSFTSFFGFRPVVVTLPMVSG